MSSFLLHLDESLRWRLISVGGFICAAEDLREVEGAWMAAREEMGIDEDESFKWNFGQTSTVRQRIEREGWGNRERRSLVIETIRGLPITLMADVLYDARDDRRQPLDFYRHALDWLVLRFRNFVTEVVPARTGPHYVVLDKPSAVSAARPTWDDPRYHWLRDREQIWYVHYKDKYVDGFRFPNRPRVPALSRDGFYPSVVVSHAKFNPILEIADAVAGLALDFTEYNLRAAEGDELPDIAWQDEQMIRVAAKFRASPSGDIYRYGFMVFPDRTPAVAPIARWVRMLCTRADFAGLRDI